MKYRKVLVTGGAGFLGSSLSIALKKNWPEIEVLAFDNLKRRGSELNLTRLKGAGVVFVHGDVRSPEDLESFEGVDLIVECSAEPSVLAGINGSPLYVLNTNLVGALNCLELARKNGADFFFISTSRVYPYDLLEKAKVKEEVRRFAFEERQAMVGLSDKGISEEFPLQGVRSLYGATKLSAEFFLAEYAANYGIGYIVNRFGCIAGPWQMGKIDQGVMALWVAAHVFGKKLKYIGFGAEGKQVRDFIHVDDAVEVIMKQIENLEDLNGEVFNVGGGRQNSISLRELTDLCEKVTEKKIEIGAEAQTRPGDLKIYVSDNRKIEERLGWKVKRSLEDIVRDTKEWMECNVDILGNIL